jgi:hypothetical protein
MENFILFNLGIVSSYENLKDEKMYGLGLLCEGNDLFCCPMKRKFDS